MAEHWAPFDSAVTFSDGRHLTVHSFRVGVPSLVRMEEVMWVSSVLEALAYDGLLSAVRGRHAGLVETEDETDLTATANVGEEPQEARPYSCHR
jgi:hypothetical protein